MTRCCKCPMPAVIYQKYSGMHLCPAHFNDDVQRKVRETLRRTGLFGHGLRLALYMDGGKGSAVMASIIKNLFARRRDIDLVALILDDQGSGAKAARTAAGQLGIRIWAESLPVFAGPAKERETISSAVDTARTAQKEGMIASLAQRIGADAIATGGDLDDEATRIFMCYLEGNIGGRQDKLPEMKRLKERQGTIPTIQPLRRIPGKEVRLYALQHGLCFSEVEVEDGMHKEAYRQLSRFDSRHPGTKYSLLRSLEKLDLEETYSSEGSRAKPLSDDEK